MAKPTAPRDNKPQTREEEENKDKKPFQLDSNVKMILIVVLSMLLGGIIFLCLNYVLIDNLLGSKLPQQTQTEDNGEDTSDEEEQVEKGIIVDLGDFVLNLADVDSKRYLKANVALELSKLPTDPDLSASQPAEGDGHGGHGGGEAADPMKAVEMEMAQYKPAIRDAIITTLSSKTSSEVATTVGKELVKEQIAQDVNAIFAGTREVIRVSFGQFIIQ